MRKEIINGKLRYYLSNTYKCDIILEEDYILIIDKMYNIYIQNHNSKYYIYYSNNYEDVLRKYNELTRLFHNPNYNFINIEKL